MIDRPVPTRRAFSLIELLVVILIIAVVMAIALPSLSGARNASRAASSRALLNNLTQAAAQFERDERRMPGYFSARDMGHADNADRGFTALQNVMADLSGGITSTNGSGPNPDGGSLRVGPLNDQATQIWVNPAYIGVERDGNKMYWVPDRKNFIAQDEGGQQAVGTTDHGKIPSVLDAFGSPVLAWVIDETAVGPVTQSDQFARVASNGGTSRFYWNSNAGFLNATNVGRRFVDQTTGNRRNGSIIGGPGGSTNARLSRSLAGILGHPSYPYRDPANPNDPPSVPAAPRGTFVVHSAGIDGIYFSRADRGAKQFPSIPDIGSPLTTSHFVDYRVNFVPDPAGSVSPSNMYTDRDGRPTNIDVVERFDDLLAVGGN